MTMRNGQKPHAEAKAKSRPKKNTTAAAEAKHARSIFKNRNTAEIEEEKRIAEAKGRPKKIITPEEEAKRAEATRARSRSK